MGVMKKKLEKIIFPWLLRALFFQSENRYYFTNLVDRMSAQTIFGPARKENVFEFILTVISAARRDQLASFYLRVLRLYSVFLQVAV